MSAKPKKLKQGDIVSHNGKRYTLHCGVYARQIHAPSVVGIDSHQDHDGYMELDDAVDLKLTKIGTTL